MHQNCRAAVTESLGSSGAETDWIELYVQATIIITITNRPPSVTVSQGVTVATEERLNLTWLVIPPTPPRQHPQDLLSSQRRAGSIAEQHHQHDSVVWPPPRPPPATDNNRNTRLKQHLNRACSDVEAGGLRARPAPLGRHYPRDFSAPSSVSIHPVWEHRTTVTYSCSVIIAGSSSVRVHTSGPRHKYCQCNTVCHCYTGTVYKQLAPSDPSPCSSDRRSLVTVQHVQVVSLNSQH